MLSAYYRFSASGAPVTEENTQSLFLRSFEHGYQSYAGIPCNLFAEYAEYLMKSKNEIDLIELAFMVFAVGLHCMVTCEFDKNTLMLESRCIITE